MTSFDYRPQLMVVMSLILCWSSNNTSATEEEGGTFLQKPPAIATTNVPPVSMDLVSRVSRYQNVRTASVIDWVGDELIIATRFGDTTQLHLVKRPLAMREQITFNHEPIRSALIPPVADPRKMVYAKDIGGNEAYQLFLMDLESRESTLITDGKSRYTAVSFSPSGNSLGYTSTEINGRDTDIFVHDLNGEKKVVQQGEGVGWGIDDWSADESKLLISRYISAVESELYEIDLNTGDRKRLLSDYPAISIGAVAYDASGNKVYFVSHLNDNFRRVYALDLMNETVDAVSPTIEWDVSYFSLSQDRRLMAVVVNEAGYSKLQVLDLVKGSHIELPDLSGRMVSRLRFSFDGSQMALNLQSTKDQSDVYVVDLHTKDLTRWTQSEMGEFSVHEFQGEELLNYTSFDHREIPVFLWRPSGEGPHPSLIYIHGGPESQSRPTFSSTFHFYLKELGVALWIPNVRGSNGYGKEYLGLDNGMLREDSVRDIGSLIKFIQQQPDMDASRIGVIGGSYGGYMVLASLVKYGDLIKAGVETVGISNFVTFLENTQDYRRDLRRAEYGDERLPEMREFLESISPLNHVAAIQSPLLIGQGLNDPRVPASESQQILEALQAQDVPAWYVLAHDEGHGFRKKPNRDYWLYVVFMFLQQHLISES